VIDDVESYFSRTHWEHPLTERERFRLDETARRLPRELGRYLDVGCGDGRLLHLLGRTGHSGEFFACDASQAGLERAGAPGVRCDVSRLPFASGSFDGVSCCEVLEHLDDAKLRAVTAELARISRRFVFLTVPHDEDLAQGLGRCAACGHVFHIHGHRQSFKPWGLVGMLPGFRTEALGVFGAGSRRRTRGWLLRLKQNRLGCWAWARDLSCPGCGSRAAEGGRRLSRAMLGGVNLLLQPRRTAGGWIYALFTRDAEQVC